MTTEMRSLRITSDFDASSYVDGMNKKIAADQAGAQSSKAVGAAVNDQKIQVSSAVPLIEKLSRTYADGYGTAAKFNTAMLQLAKSQDTNASSVEHLEAVYAGMQQRFGLQADATVLASRGYNDLAKAIDNVNSRLTTQRGIQADINRTPTPAPGHAANDNGSQYRRQNLQYQLFDIGQTAAMGMNPAMILAQQGPQIIQLYAGQGGVNAAMKDFTGLLGSAARFAGPLAAVGVAAYVAYKTLANNTVEARMAVDEATKALASQAASVGSVTSQIGELTGVQKAYSKAIEETGLAHTTMTAGIVEGTERQFEAKKALLELEVKRQEALVKVQQSELAITQHQLQREVAGKVNTRLDLESRGFADPAVGRFVNNIPDDITGLAATRKVLENSPLTDKIKEMRANLTLTEEAANSLRDALARTFKTVQGPDSPDFGPGGLAGPGSILPDLGSLGGLFAENGKLYSPEDFMPKTELPTPARRPLIELEGLPGELKTNTSTAQSYRDLIKNAQDRIDQMKLEAQVSGQTGIAAERMRFQLTLLQDAQDKGRTITQDQRTEIEKLGDAYSEAAQKAAKLKLQADSQFDREQLGRSAGDQRIAQQLRGAGLPVDMNSYEAGILRANDALRDQVKAWESIRDIGRDAIDQITGSALTGFTNIKDVLNNVSKDILKSVTQLGISNPLKNAIYGDQLPTLGGVGGVGGMLGALFGGSNPAARGGISSTASMSVTAGMVTINGSVGGGIGNLLGGAANDNASTANGDVASYITQAALKRGIDPATALAVAKSEGGLNSWNMQSSVVKNGVQEPSFGPYQLYMNGGLGNAFQRQTGLDPRQAANGPAGIDFALDHASKNGWGSWYGADKAGIGKWQGIGVDTNATAAVTKFATASEKATTNLGGFGQGLDVLSSGLGSLGGGLSQIGKIALGQGASPGGGLFGSILGSIGKFVGGISPTSSLWAPNTTLGSLLVNGFDTGGYTGAGGVNQPRGVVHAGEVVWSQSDIARAGGVAVVEGMRLGLTGYARGGAVDWAAPARAPIAANVNGQPSQQSAGSTITVNNYGNDQVHAEETTDQHGKKRTTIVIGEMVASSIRDPGNPARKAMQNQFGLRSTKVAR